MKKFQKVLAFLICVAIISLVCPAFSENKIEEETDFLDTVIKKAENGDPESQYLLGHMYDYGELLEQDSAEAFIWYKKAAEQGHVEAQFMTGIMYVMILRPLNITEWRLNMNIRERSLILVRHITKAKA